MFVAYDEARCGALRVVVRSQCRLQPRDIGAGASERRHDYPVRQTHVTERQGSEKISVGAVHILPSGAQTARGPA
jgi:hypothetical protein